jgi:hypothetical protein
MLSEVSFKVCGSVRDACGAPFFRDGDVPNAKPKRVKAAYLEGNCFSKAILKLSEGVHCASPFVGVVAIRERYTQQYGASICCASIYGALMSIVWKSLN